MLNPMINEFTFNIIAYFININPRKKIRKNKYFKVICVIYTHIKCQKDAALYIGIHVNEYLLHLSSQILSIKMIFLLLFNLIGRKR